MRTSEIAWVSGWGSDISIWENEIYERFPNFSHRFIDYFDLLPNPDDFWEGNPRIAESEIIVGWSMGTLALLRNLQKKPPEQRWILICPIADFCAKGCWSVAALRAMRQGILKNTEKTLMSFSALMGDTPKEEREKWVENAMRYSPKQLATGLDYLMQKNADLTAKIPNAEFIFGEQDKVVPLAQKELFAAQEDVKIADGLGHWITGYVSAKHTLQPNK